ncbi:hypothetical protein PTKIN_Ptkin03bG0144700 [Pterospermum kingtungense]
MKGFLRIRVGLKLESKLVDGFWIPIKDRDGVWAFLKYEKLFDFCLFYGKLGYVAKRYSVEAKKVDYNAALMKCRTHLCASSGRSGTLFNKKVGNRIEGGDNRIEGGVGNAKGDRKYMMGEGSGVINESLLTEVDLDVEEGMVVETMGKIIVREEMIHGTDEVVHVKKGKRGMKCMMGEGSGVINESLVTGVDLGVNEEML